MILVGMFLSCLFLVVLPEQLYGGNDVYMILAHCYMNACDVVFPNCD